ncbi:Tkl protein kinase [Globisporangium polare]
MEMVERALHANADLASGTSDASAVQVACESGHKNVLRVLLANGATVDALVMTKLVSVTINTRRFDLTRLLIGERMNPLSADLRENAALCAWLFRRVVLVFDSLFLGSMSSATEEATITRCEEVTKLLLVFCWKHSQPSNVFYALARSRHGLWELETIRLLLDDVTRDIRLKVVSKPRYSVIDATLETLDEYTRHTREFESMWDSVVQRLVNFYGHMKTDKDLFAKGISQLLAIIFGLVRLKKVCEAKNIFFRVTVSRHVANRIRDFHTEIDDLQKDVEDIENAQWEYDPAKMVQVFRATLSERHRIYLSLRYDQFETISLLQNELQRHCNHHSEEMLELLHDCLKMVLDFSKIPAVPSVPEWLIPHHELDFDQSRQAQHRRDGARMPFRAKWFSSAVMLGDLDLPHQAVVRAATRWYNLRHPNLVDLFGVAYLHDPCVAVYDVCQATNLREYLSSPQNKQLVWQKLCEIALGLAFLHEKSITLGNFQCRHLWVDELGVAKINGFEIAASNLQPEQDPESVRWQPPECVRGGSSSLESDMYTFGMCILEAVSGQVPWSGEKTAEEAASRIKRAATPLQPADMTDAQWRMVQEMIWSNPLQRWKISRVVAALKFFAEDADQLDPKETAGNAPVTSLDLHNHVFSTLEISLEEQLETLEHNISIPQENSEEIGLIFLRLKRIYEWLCSNHKRPSDLGVAIYCKILLEFKEFLRISAYNPKSKLERAKSQKVSLRNNVLHEKIDELLEVLDISGSGSIHEWRKHRPVDNDNHSDADDDNRGTNGEPEGDTKISSSAVKIVPFGTGASAWTSSSPGSVEKPWLIPIHKLQFTRKELIGEGSFGEVVRGTWSKTPVVIKLVVDADKCSQELFLHELRIWWQLRHPNVARLYGACDVDKRCFVCESIADGTLRDYLKLDKNRDKKWQKLHEIAQGLRYLHENSILHNDLKGDNFLIGADGKAKIIDFGFSSILNIAEVKFNVKKLGALGWRSPECLQGNERLTLKSDVYAFGMCIVEAISGGYPWGGMSDAGVRIQVLRKKSLPLQPETMSDRHWSLIKTMCAFDPKDRIGIASVVDRLDEFAQQEAAAAKAESALIP